EWDSKSWNWDGVMFVAQPAVGRTTELRSRSFFDKETPSPPQNGEKSLIREDNAPEEAESLSLKLGGSSYTIVDEDGSGARGVKRFRSSSPQSQSPMCQVDNCKADLSKAKDYHRRHKVCEIHSKAVKASVTRLMQRFCQQCSRFHPLAEFDEGKRSCRRRLEGHNRRRRKTQPDSASRAYLMGEEDLMGKGGAGLVGGLLHILAQLQASSSLDRANVPIVDREALLRKAVLASLEDRTTPSWNQLIPNLDHLAAGLLSRQEQRAPSNGHAATDLSIETQYLLSRLAAGSSPEALALLLQSSGQLSTAPRHAQDAPGSHLLAQEAAAVPVLQQTHASSSAPDSLRMQACPSQRLVGNSSCGHAAAVSTPVPDSPHVSIEPFIRSTDSSSLARPIAERPMLNPDRLALQVDQAPPATPTVQRLFPQQSTANHSTAANGNNASWRTDAGISSAIGGRGSSMVSSFGTHETRPSLRPIPADPRPAVQQPAIVQLSDSSQSGSDEQLPVLSSADSETWTPTRRISLKLFDRSPEDLPANLRMQIDVWLARLPTDMESYIRPGCVVLTIYVSMPHSAWVQLDRDLRGSLENLLSTCNDEFWHKGRILVQVEHQRVLIVDGNIMERKFVNPLSQPYIQSVRPLAIVAGQETKICFKGFNLGHSSGTRLLCVYQGKHLSQDSSTSVEDEEADSAMDHNFTLRGEHADVVGRCFMEAEQNLRGGNSKPVIIANTSICKELCKLEEEIEAATLRAADTAKREGLESFDVLVCSEVARAVVEEDVACFLHELGWYFQSSSYWQLNNNSGSLDMVQAFRLKRLLVFSVERDWCTVVRKLLDMPFERAKSESFFTKLSHVVQDDMSLLHQAVRRKCRPMVELLLAYVPSSLTKESDVGLETLQRIMQFKLQWGNLFRPDMAGPAGLTPLHIAASMKDAEDVVDALTSDPCQVGLHAWVNKQDESRQTPLSLALEGGNVKSVELVRVKLALLDSTGGNVAINIPGDSFAHIPDGKFHEGASRSISNLPAAVNLPLWGDRSSASGRKHNAGKAPSCRALANRPGKHGALHGYIPKSFMLSLVSIAAVCVCVCLVFRNAPCVKFVMPPFRWEHLGGGPQ
ncbi:unnamed protein product, partial [Sphagnum compactum]